jgi:hypothetical protein
MKPSQYEIAYYKAGFAEAIWIIEGVLKNKLYKDSQVDRIARRTVEAIVTTLRKTALKEIEHFERRNRGPRRELPEELRHTRNPKGHSEHSLVHMDDDAIVAMSGNS